MLKKKPKGTCTQKGFPKKGEEEGRKTVHKKKSNERKVANRASSSS